MLNAGDNEKGCCFKENLSGFSSLMLPVVAWVSQYGSLFPSPTTSALRTDRRGQLRQTRRLNPGDLPLSTRATAPNAPTSSNGRRGDGWGPSGNLGFQWGGVRSWRILTTETRPVAAFISSYGGGRFDWGFVRHHQEPKIRFRCSRHNSCHLDMTAGTETRSSG